VAGVQQHVEEHRDGLEQRDLRGPWQVHIGRLEGLLPHPFHRGEQRASTGHGLDPCDNRIQPVDKPEGSSNGPHHIARLRLFGAHCTLAQEVSDPEHDGVLPDCRNDVLAPLRLRGITREVVKQRQLPAWCRGLLAQHPRARDVRGEQAVQPGPILRALQGLADQRDGHAHLVALHQGQLAEDGQEGRQHVPFLLGPCVHHGLEQAIDRGETVGQDPQPHALVVVHEHVCLDSRRHERQGGHVLEHPRSQGGPRLRRHLGPIRQLQGRGLDPQPVHLIQDGRSHQRAEAMRQYELLLRGHQWVEWGRRHGEGRRLRG
jgi:hypothetical protein